MAELAGRTQVKATDVVQALQDLEPSAVDMKDLVKTLGTAKRPFPRDVPAFPARKRDVSSSTMEQTKIGRREQLPPHVPSFVPPLPNRHTYSSESRLVVEREQDTKRQRLELISEKAQVRQSLHGLQTVAASTSRGVACCRCKWRFIVTVVCVSVVDIVAERSAVSVHQPTWNAFQGSTGDSGTGNPFVQAPIVSPNAKVGFALAPSSIVKSPKLLVCIATVYFHLPRSSVCTKSGEKHGTVQKSAEQQRDYPEAVEVRCALSCMCSPRGEGLMLVSHGLLLYVVVDLR